MTNPPGPPPLGPPPQGPPPGWEPAPTIPPGGFPPYDARRTSHTGLVVALVVLGLVLLCAAAAALLLILRSDGGDDPRAGGGAGAPASGSAPADPSTTTTPLEKSGDVRAADFPGDWSFRLGDVELSATLRESHDHGSCAPVEADRQLTRQGCQYAVQWVYSALHGDVRQTHLFLVFASEHDAKAAQRGLTEQQLDLPAGSTLPRFSHGKWNTSVYGNIVGVTVGTARPSVSEKQLGDLVSYMNSDYRLALAFKL